MCPHSVRLCEQFPEDGGSEYAAEGTEAHELCEFKLKTALGMDAEDPTPNLTRYSDEMDDCGAGRIDMIITKSISRFARNTLDCLKYIRALKAQNIPVYFEKESINTLDAKGEVLLTIMVSLAQQESQSLSQNVKLGLQYRYQQGKVQVNHSRFLGYTKDAEGNLIIDPEQAEIVKRIYR